MAQVRYSGPGLAILGLAHLAAQGVDDAFDHLLDVATTGAPAVLAALQQVISPLMEARLGCLASLVRLGLEASVSPWRDGDRPEAYEAAKAERTARLGRRREHEQLWLHGQGPLPPWPRLPEIRREKRPRGMALPVDPTAEADEAQATEAAVDRVLEVFNSQMAGAWLSLLEDAPGVFQTALPAEVVDAYRLLSNFLAGQGLDPAIELTSLASPWLGPFQRLQLRAAAGLPWDRFKTAVLDDVLTLTDQGFCTAVEAVAPLADGLAVAGTLPVAVLEPFRAALGERLRRTRLWAWRKDEIGDTLATNIAGAVLALFVHRPFPWGSFECRLPASAEALGPILPALAALAVDAPGSSYVATLLMNDLERAQAWARPDLLASAAEAWWAKRGPDLHFWRQLEFGRRVCQWFLDRLEREALDAALLARIQTVADRLAEAGIPEAITLERQLATVQTH